MYSIRRPGCTAWATDLTLDEAEAGLRAANQVVPGHIIVADPEPEYFTFNRTRRLLSELKKKNVIRTKETT